MSFFSSDPGTPGQKTRRGKPAIWTAGGQRPRLDLRAFLRVSLMHARDLSAPAAAATAAALGRFAGRVIAGEVRVPEARLGRLGRALPPHRPVGLAIDSAARLIAEGARRAAGPTPIEPLTFRGWDAAVTGLVEAPVVTVTVAPVPLPTFAELQAAAAPPPRPVLKAVEPAVDDADRATLDAIRNVIHATEIEPKRPARAKLRVEPPPPRSANLPDLAPMEPVPPGPVFLAAAGVLGAVFVGLAWPIGAAQSAWMAARGVDLRLVE